MANTIPECNPAFFFAWWNASRLSSGRTSDTAAGRRWTGAGGSCFNLLNLAQIAAHGLV